MNPYGQPTYGYVPARTPRSLDPYPPGLEYGRAERHYAQPPGRFEVVYQGPSAAAVLPPPPPPPQQISGLPSSLGVGKTYKVVAVTCDKYHAVPGPPAVTTLPHPNRSDPYALYETRPGPPPGRMYDPYGQPYGGYY